MTNGRFVPERGDTIEAAGTRIYISERGQDRARLAAICVSESYGSLQVDGVFADYAARAIRCHADLTNAAEQALSDLEWVEKAAPSGANFQSSIILLRYAIAKAKGEAHE